MPPAIVKPHMLERLLDVSRQMAETRELDPLLNYAMMVAMDLVDAEMGYLILLEDQTTIDFRVRLHRDGRPVEQPIQQISHSILSKVVFEREDMIIANAIEDSGFQDAESVVYLKLRSVMAVPLISREKVLGALYVENRSEKNVFRSEDLKVLKFFAGQAAVAVENAILNDDLEARVAARTAELQQANERLQQNWNEAVEFNRIRTSFLSTIVHDIRSPLSTVLNAQALMKEGVFGDLTEEQDQWVETSIQTVNHVIRLTEDIFDLTKLEMGKLTLYPEQVELPKYFQQIFSVGKVLPWKHGVTFRHNIAPELPATYTLDPTRIQQVILNLVSNAQKFTESGEVIFYARAENNTLVFGVRDTGAGIAEADLSTIFERFKQSGTRQMRQQGTGLGLAITQEIVTLHGGQITVTSELGKGSDFRVTLPLTPLYTT